MLETKSVCVVDCREWLSRYRFTDGHMTEEDAAAVLVAATTLAVDNLYVDPILSFDSLLAPSRASAMARSISVHISDRFSEALTEMPNSDAYEAKVTTESEVDSGLVILTLSVAEAGDA